MWTIPLILLVAVAAHHRWRVWSVGQTPWKGGGFAMFADVQRTFDITEIRVAGPHGMSRLRVAADLQDHYLRKQARAIPTRKNMLAWAHWVSRAEWAQAGESAYLRSLAHEGKALDVIEVVVRHCEREFDCVTGTHTLNERTSYVVSRHGT